MLNRFVTSFILVAGIVGFATANPSLALRAQTTAPPRAAAGANQNASSKPADLSGDWVQDEKRGFIGQSASLSDMGGKLRGKEPDIPYMPWSLQKTLSEIPPTGPDAKFDQTTDPWILYCEPPGLVRIYMAPARTRFVQTPDTVYILHEVMQAFRVVRLNSKHPDDPDPQWWGDSIGWYENGDTLVVDTIGINDKTWLDQIGHPHTDKMHLIERYKRVNQNTMEFDATIDDPGAYTKPFQTHRNFTISKAPFMAHPWVCSVRENQNFYNNVGKPAAPAI
jgi:hypothetical protein